MIDRSKMLVVGLLALAALAAGVAVWVRYAHSDQAVALWGKEHAARIRNAPQVEVWRLAAVAEGKPIPAPNGQLVNVESRRELRDIRDLSYIRAAFLNDSFIAQPERADCVPAWRYVIRFGNEGESTTLWVDESCNVVQLSETGEKTTMHAGILNSIRTKFLDYYIPPQKGLRDPR